MAAARDNISDAWVSIGAVIGIVGSQFGLPWLDPVTAIIVGLLICKTAWDIFREATHHLTDGFDVELIQEYRETIAGIDGVETVKDVRARNYGSNAVVDVVITVREIWICNKHMIFVPMWRMSCWKSMMCIRYTFTSSRSQNRKRSKNTCNIYKKCKIASNRKPVNDDVYWFLMLLTI